MRGPLGRRHSVDERDRRFLIADLPLEAVWGRRFYWSPTSRLDQQGGSCTGFSQANWWRAAPVTHDFEVDPYSIYHLAQELDEWDDTPPEEGSSVRAAAKAMVERGHCLSYYWAWDLETMLAALLAVGPVVVGTTWRSGMDDPDTDGFIHNSGLERGGHAYLIDGLNTDLGYVRMMNSWGPGWGAQGRAKISLDDAAALIEDEGEIALMREVAT